MTDETGSEDAFIMDVGCGDNPDKRVTYPRTFVTLLRSSLTRRQTGGRIRMGKWTELC